MSERGGDRLYPAVLLAADAVIGLFCYEAGASVFAVLLWLTGASMCLAVLVSLGPHRQSVAESDAEDAGGYQK